MNLLSSVFRIFLSDWCAKLSAWHFSSFNLDELPTSVIITSFFLFAQHFQAFLVASQVTSHLSDAFSVFIFSYICRSNYNSSTHISTPSGKIFIPYLCWDYKLLARFLLLSTCCLLCRVVHSFTKINTFISVWINSRS